MRESGATKLTLGFASSNIFAEDMGDIEILVSQSSFDELHIRLYSKPLNIIELFDLIKWKASPKMKIILEFINLDLPLDINLYEYLYLSEKMVKRNNGIMPLASFSIIFNPLFYKFDPIDSYIMEPDKYKRLSQFPTKKLFI